MKPAGIWKFYFLFYLLVLTVNIAFFFAAESPAFLYYQISLSYGPKALPWFITSMLSLALSALALLCIYLYIYQIRFLNAGIWKWILLLRLPLELLGHHYERNILLALWKGAVMIRISDFQIPVVFPLLLIGICFHLPSYLAMYAYAFNFPARSVSPSAGAAPSP